MQTSEKVLEKKKHMRYYLVKKAHEILLGKICGFLRLGVVCKLALNFLVRL